jgi:hypothetical protein
MVDWRNEWIEIFMSGSYGDKGTWTEDDIDEVVSNFASGVWRPPAVLGHPATDAPAMGWVSALRKEGRVLKAKFEQVQPELESQIVNGRFPNRSAAFYTDPQGKGLVLRHVGFLGATPPTVKGLAPIRFSHTAFVEITLPKEQEQIMSKTNQAILETALAFAESQAYAKKHHINLPAGMILTGIPENDRAQAIAKERNISFVEGLEAACTERAGSMRPGSRVRIDPDSLFLDALAEALSKKKGIEFGEALAQAQEFEPGLSAAQIAELLGVSIKDTSTAEAKTKIAKIAEVYGCSPETAEKLFLLGHRVGG